MHNTLIYHSFAISYWVLAIICYVPPLRLGLMYLFTPELHILGYITINPTNIAYDPYFAWTIFCNADYNMSNITYIGLLLVFLNSVFKHVFGRVFGIHLLLLFSKLSLYSPYLLFIKCTLHLWKTRTPN